MKTRSIIRSVFYFLACSILFAACKENANTTSTYHPDFAADTLEKNVLIFGFPSFSYSESAEPLIKYLNKNASGWRIKMKACITYEEYKSLISQKKIDLTLISGIQAYLSTDSGYSIIGKISNDKAYTSVIFSRKSAGVENVSDLKGKKVALVPAKIIPGTMMPLYYLFQKGLDVNHDIDRV